LLQVHELRQYVRVQLEPVVWGVALVSDVVCGADTVVRQRIGEGMMKKKIFVTVSGGCAYVIDDTVPEGFEVEIVDFDNIAAGDSFPSIQALNYCLNHGLYQPSRMT